MKNLKVLAAAVIALGVLVALGGGVNASPDSNEVKGTLNAVDVANLIVTVDNQDFPVLPTATVTVEHQGRIPFEQLPDYIGRRVELKLNADGLVYKIEVKGQDGDEDGEDD